jgi:hypothetical protein
MNGCSRRQFALALCAAGVSIAGSGCGTLIYPERRGQPKGQLDWGIVALDGLGLLLFLVPGLIAFAVDFGTGAIYLPPGQTSDGYSGEPTAPRGELSTHYLPPDQLTDDRLEALLAALLHQPVKLGDNCRRVPLQNIQDFWPATDRLLAEVAAGIEPGIRRAQSPE